MNEPLQRAIAIYEQAGWDFGRDYAACFEHGEIQQRPDYFLMGRSIEGGGFYVRFLAGDFRAAIKANAGRFQFVRFARELRARKDMRDISFQTLERHG